MKRTLKIMAMATLGCLLVGTVQAREGRKSLFTSPYRAAPAPVQESAEQAMPASATTVEPPTTLPTVLPAHATTEGALEQQSAPAQEETHVDGNVMRLNATSEGGVTKLNSKRLQFNFDVRDVGPSGVKTVEVWCTRDSGKTWEKFNSEIQQTGGFVDVTDEGVYGIRFVAKTGFGGGLEAPAPGDAPQLVFEVDTIKPVVNLVGLQPSAGGRTLRVDWTASDKNLTKRPIVLYYGLDKAGPWVPFTPPLENIGSFTWSIPPGTPNSFWLRVEAADTAGNIATTESQSAIHIDLSTPEVTNIRVLPIGQEKQ